MQLKNLNGGYWGYLNHDVRETIADKLDNIEVVDANAGHLAVNSWEVGIEGLGVLGNTQTAGLVLTGIPTYADNTAASSMAVGAVYKTPTGELRIKI